MVLNAYIDGSGNGDPDLLVLAGYIATAETWTEFSKEWQARLDCAGLEYFKMNQMASKTEIAGWFYRILEAHDIRAAVACIIHTNELVRVNRRIKYPSYITNSDEIENPYYYGIKYIIHGLALDQVNLRITEPVDFIFDDESVKRRVLNARDLIKSAAAPEYAPLIGKIPKYGDDKKLKPLQAADLYAWWILNWERNGLIKAVVEWPFPWGVKKYFPRLAMRLRERDFLADASRSLASRALNSDELAYAKSLMPPGYPSATVS